MTSPKSRWDAIAIAMPRPRTLLLPLRVIPLFLTAAALAIAGFEAVSNPAIDRPLVALVLLAGLLFVAIRRPGLAILLSFGFLVVLALIRRLLIPVAGWSSYDPLLLVAPVVALSLLQRFLLKKDRQIAPDLLSKLVVSLVVLALLQTANPLGGGLFVGLAGLLFIAAPLLWFFLGAELADRRLITGLFISLVVLAVAESLYGLRQTFAGLPPWDAQWLDVSGYSALLVYSPVHPGGVIRAFGSFTSSSEYATYLGIALVVAFSLLLHRRLLALLAIPLIGWALFLDSSRGIIILVLVTAVALIGLRPRKPVLGALVIGAAMVAGGITLRILGPSLQTNAIASGNSLVAHQVSGLLNPFDADQSTLLQHWDRALAGVSYALQNPLGSGTASTNLAGDKLAGTNLGTEVDVSNVFVSLGLLGGAIFVAIIGLALVKAILLYRRERDVTAFAVAGVLVVTLGQWLNGGQYAVAPLVWFLIGWSSRQRKR